MLLNVPFESTVLEEVSISINGISLESSLGIKCDVWMLLKVELDTWVLKHSFVVFDSGVHFNIVVKFDTWSLAPWHVHGMVSNDDSWVRVGVISDDNSWVGVGVIGDDDSWVGVGVIGNDDSWVGVSMISNDDSWVSISGVSNSNSGVVSVMVGNDNSWIGVGVIGNDNSWIELGNNDLVDG